MTRKRERVNRMERKRKRKGGKGRDERKREELEKIGTKERNSKK